MSTPMQDPARFFADLYNVSQEQMRKLLGGAAAPGMPQFTSDPAAAFAEATRHFTQLQQQYLENLQKMTGAAGGAAAAAGPMAAATKQFGDLQRQYVENLQKMMGVPAAPSAAAEPMAEATRQLTQMQQQYMESLQRMTGFAGAGVNPSDAMTGAIAPFAKLQQQYVENMQGFANAWSAATGLMQQANQAPAEDKRFAGDKWTEDPRFDAIKRMYLAYSDFIQKAIETAPVDTKDKARLQFAGRQFIDAMSPANFFTTNPEAIALAIETGGASVTEGFKRFIEDFAKGRITITDESAFEVGRNMAMTPGTVIHENELMQLIQYTPTTPRVHERPLVIVPPCINKFYILDLQPENSFVAYAVSQGLTVFMVSWRNVTEAQATRTWDDYLRHGPMEAIDVALDVTGADQANTLGFCIGGTLLTSAASVLQTNGEDKIASLTLLTSMLDFTDAGEIGLLVDEQAVQAREAAIGKGGLLNGKELGFVFSSLRANDLIWPYVVSSYLKGKAPPAFDLLNWNSDATNLPGPMFCWYVRHCYLQNDLCKPGKTVQCDVPVDLSALDVPAYLYSSREDHIVPWKTAYASMRILSGDRRFVLGASGHIAGVINPPSKNKRNYWARGKDGGSADEWMATAEQIPGSWWPDWSQWIAQHAGEEVVAPKAPGNRRYRPVEPAPGRYVKEKAV